ncbi:hypothetical protein Tsubulata_015301 [Turnera subulata]|uniref:DUF4283 domain-containing protein n=1 Tax=Turnera subulata TaxID=218843 RepID=A0A9Q0JE96_9ROSI|nr:hypothetical protein Tsubulata_015301 [Turnera subulata]
MAEGQPPDGGPQPSSIPSNSDTPGVIAPSRIFKDTLIQGSAWNEPTIDTEFDIGDGEVLVTSSPHGPIVQYSPSFRVKLHKNWDNTLIIKPWGRRIGYKALSSRLPRLWQLRNGIRVIDLEHNYYMVKFYSREDNMKVLTGGPWLILGHYLSVETLRPNFNPSTQRVSSVIAWVRIPGLPAEHYHIGVLRLVGNQLGRTVRIDMPTQQTDRAQFARIAVELDLNKPLEPKVCFEDIWYNIAYENLPQVCFECGMACHNMSACPSRAPAAADVESPADTVHTEKQTLVDLSITKNQAGVGVPKESSDVVTEPKCGKWMLISRKPQNQPRKSGEILENKSQQKTSMEGSRFAILVDQDDNTGGKGTVGFTPGGASTAPMRPSATKMTGTNGQNKGKSVANQRSTSAPCMKRARQNEDALTSVPVVFQPTLPKLNPKEQEVVKVVLKQNPTVISPDVAADHTSTQIAHALVIPGTYQLSKTTKFSPSHPPVSTVNPPCVSGSKADSGLAIAFDSNNKRRDGAGSAKFDRAFRDMGRAGGIWVCWQKARISVCPIEVHPQFILMQVSWRSGLTSYVTEVYASPKPALRYELWQRTRVIAAGMSAPWVIAGDFNSLLGPNEKLGGEVLNTTYCRVFSDWIDDCELVDLGFKGSPYTWERGEVQERLDRVLANTSWSLPFPDAEVVHYPRTKSDHSTLLLRLWPQHDSVGPKPFRFLAAWLVDGRLNPEAVATFGSKRVLSKNLPR